MQKKIIALAVASAMTMPALALAEASIYGQVNMAYEMTDNGGSATPAPVGNNAETRNQVSSYVSRLGFKGSDDLGDGMKAVWQMEAQVNPDAPGTISFTRNTFVGMGGDFGTVVLGNHDTPYKMSTRSLDAFADSIADNRNIMGVSAISHDARLGNVVAYLTPNFSGFTGAVAIVGKTDNTLNAGATVANATSLSGNYARDNWTVALANQNVTMKNAGVNVTDTTATKLAGSYAMDAFTVGLVYEMLSDKIGAAGVKTEQNNVYISGKYKVSDAGTAKLGYTMAGESKTAGTANTGSGATQVSLGYDHSMTKNTTLFALYTSVANDTAANYGLSTNSTGGFKNSAGADKDPSAFAVGIRHKF